MSEYMVQGSSLKSIADAIREKIGVTDALTLEMMTEAINSIGDGSDEEISIHGMTLLHGTYTVAEDITGESYHDIVVKSGVSSAPEKRYSMIFIIDGFPPGDSTSHFVGGVGLMEYSYTSFKYYGLYGYQSGYGGQSNAEGAGENNINKYDRNSKTLKISIYTKNNKLRAGTTYGWIYMYK